MHHRSKRRSAIALFASAFVASSFLSAPAEAAGRSSSVTGAALYKDPSYPPTSDHSFSRLTDAPNSRWLVGPDAAELVERDINGSRSAGAVPVFVAYNIPGRDCGGASSGGVDSSDSYNAWTQEIATAIGTTRAVVIVEPDALSNFDCLDAGGQSTRLSMLRNAVDTYARSAPNTAVYIDAGHSNWIAPSTMADRLNSVGVANARGFSVNVAGFNRTSDELTYASAIAEQLDGAGFVIDTSRNGNGSNGEWCNPHGRALGEQPSTSTGTAADAFLWVKRPGESDGHCNGGPGAGQWWGDYARSLINN